MSSTPVAYTINHEGLKLDIALLETEKLLIHEKTIPFKLNKLKKRIEQDGVQSAPILVDRNTLVVLDGMHRTAIMKELGCRFTCVCLIDYFDPSIKVQRWCRIIPGPFTEKNAEAILEDIDLQLEPYDLVKSPDEDGGLLLLFKDSSYRLVSDVEDLVEVFDRSYALERKLEDWGYKIMHCTESEAIKQLEIGEYEAAMYLPKVKKSNVVEFASNHQILTPKATRHRLPARPVAVNIPLALLRDKQISVEEANKKLTMHLKQKHVERCDVGTEWMGRTYDEVLYIFSDL